MTVENFFDRRVPLAIIGALCLQAAGVVWWASARDADVTFQQRRLDHLELGVAEQRTSQTEMLQRLARIEERVKDETALLEHIDRQLNRNRQ